MTGTGGTVDPTAVAGRRVAAAVIDVGIGWLLNLILFLLFAERADTFGLLGCSDIDTGLNQCVSLGDTLYVLEGFRAFVVWAIVLAYFVGVFIVQRGLTGRTLGTMALGIVVVDAQGAPPGIPRALVRSVAGIVDYIPCCLPLVGLITIFTTGRHQRVGDLAASTFVVDRAFVGQPVGAATPAAATPSLSSGRPVTPPPAPTTPPAPATPVAPTPTATTPPTAQAGPQPQWDPQRNAYIAWDHAAQRWLRYDDPTGQWRPIEEEPS